LFSPVAQVLDLGADALSIGASSADEAFPTLDCRRTSPVLDADSAMDSAIGSAIGTAVEFQDQVLR
jgi:hypothetical protein